MKLFRADTCLSDDKGDLHRNQYGTSMKVSLWRIYSGDPFAKAFSGGDPKETIKVGRKQ